MADQLPGDREHLRPGLLVAIAAVLVVVVLAGVVYLVTRDDDGDSSAPAVSTTTLPVDTSVAVWPSASATTRYADPVSAARGFATDFVGFDDPVVGEFRQGDTRSGEVPVQATTTGPITTVLVRRLGDSWYVLGSSTPNIEVTAPEARSAIASPVRLQGRSTTFEATVNVEVRGDDIAAPIGTGIVMGGANGEMGGFDGTIAFTRPPSDAGALVLLTTSPENGKVSEATVVHVDFA